MLKSSNKNIIRKIISTSSDEYKSTDELRRQLNSLKINGNLKPDNLITIDSIQRQYFELQKLPAQPFSKSFLNAADSDDVSFFRIKFDDKLDKTLINSFIEKIKQQYFYGFKQGAEKQEEFSTTIGPSDVSVDGKYNFFDNAWEKAAEVLSDSNLENVIYDYSYEPFLNQEDVQNFISNILVSYSYEQAEELINNFPIQDNVRERIRQLYYSNRAKSSNEKQQALNFINLFTSNREVYVDYVEPQFTNAPYGIEAEVVAEKEIDLGFYGPFKQTINYKKLFDEILTSTKSLNALVFENNEKANIKVYEQQANNLTSFTLGAVKQSSELSKYLNKAKLFNLIDKYGRDYKQIFDGNLCFRQRIGFVVSKYKNNKLIKSVFLETEKDVVNYFDQQVPYFYNYTYKFEQCELIIGNKYEYFDRLFPIITSLTELEKLKLQKMKQLISIAYLYKQNLLYKYKTNFAIDLQKINSFIATNEFKNIYNYQNLNLSISNKPLDKIADYASLDTDILHQLAQSFGVDVSVTPKGSNEGKLYNDLIKDYFGLTQTGILSFNLWQPDPTKQEESRSFDIDKLKLGIDEQTFNFWKMLEEGKTETQLLSQNDAFGLIPNNNYYPRLYNNQIDFCVKNTKEIKLVKHEIFKAENVLVQSKPPLAPSINVIGFKDVNNKIKFNFIHNSGELKEKSIDLNYEPYMEIAQFRKKENDGLVSFNNDEPIKSVLIFKSEKKPESYKDFSFYQVQDNLLGSFNEYVEPNKKYWYTFVSQDIHGLFSNPSIIYQVEILSENKLCYVVSSIYEFEKKETSNVFYIKNNLKITPNYQHIIPINDDLQTIILKSNNLFSKTFKFRIKSLSTNKVIDLNVDVNKILQK